MARDATSWLTFPQMLWSSCPSRVLPLVETVRAALTGQATTRMRELAVTPYQTHQLWQIERCKTTAEQRAADAQLGMFLAASSRSARQAVSTTVGGAARSLLRIRRAVQLGGTRIAARVAD